VRNGQETWDRLGEASASLGGGKYALKSVAAWAFMLRREEVKESSLRKKGRKIRRQPRLGRGKVSLAQ